MTARLSSDGWWIIAQVLWIGGCVGLYLAWWIYKRPEPESPRDAAAALVDRIAAGHYTWEELGRTYVIEGRIVTFPQRVRVVRPPYDWAVHGDGHEVVNPKAGTLDAWGVRP